MLSSNLKKLILLTLAGMGLAKKRYDDYQVIRVPNAENLEATLKEGHVSILGHEVGSVSVLVAPEDLDWFQKNIKEFTVLNPNLQDAIDEEAQYIEQASQERGADWFKNYHRLEEMLEWYHSFAQDHSDLVTLIPSIGKSHEGRDLIALKITGKKGTEGTKKQLWLQGQIHAREWISGITVQYILDNLVSNYGKDSEATKILDDAELVIVPIQNPDGYVYTWDEDRMWRKNRNGDGVDLNRNWGDHWGGEGSSDDPSDDTYHGTSAFSESETKAVSDFMLKHKNIVGAIDFHSFSELLLRPAGWTYDDQPFEQEHVAAADAMNKAMASAGRGKKYQNIKSSDLYIACGVASDWFYGETVLKNQGFRPYSFTIELSPSQGNFGQGFVLPPTEIIPVGKEISKAFRAFANIAIKSPLKEN